MNYRAQLHGVPGERPVVTFASSPDALKVWAETVLAGHDPSKFPNARVVVSKLEERSLAVYRRASDADKTIKEDESA